MREGLASERARRPGSAPGWRRGGDSVFRWEEVVEVVEVEVGVDGGTPGP